MYSDKSQRMTVAVPLYSDCMGNICRSLNKCVGRLKNWKNLANALDVPSHIYKDFDPNNVQSPTETLFRWLSTQRLDLTVEQLCAALRDIGRNDVVLLLKEKFRFS